MIKSGLGTPGFNKQKALISINILVDLDVGLYKLIRDEYLDPNIFDAEFLMNASTVDLIKKSFFRESDNLLYPIAKTKDYKLLDSYFEEFITTEFNAIYDRAVYTDVLSLLFLLSDFKDIDISIMYYKDYSKGKLEEDIKNGVLPPDVTLVDGKKLSSIDINSYTQIYFRSIYEFDVLPLDKLTTPKNFYISNFRPNFDHRNELLRTNALNSIMTGKLRHEINIINTYSVENVKLDKKEKEEGDTH